MNAKERTKKWSNIQTPRILLENSAKSDVKVLNNCVRILPFNMSGNGLQTITDVERKEKPCELSVVCINNNDDVLNRFLIPSIQKQVDVKYELIIIDNKENHYKGARTAFNEVIKDLKGEYVVFVHNDFCFSDVNAFQQIDYYCKKLKPFGVIGLAGCGFDYKNLIMTRIKQGIDKRAVGVLIDKPMPVMSVDECCFIIRKSQINAMPFIDKNGWHLYAVEYCLKMLDCGLHNYVIPIEGWHYSDGVSLNSSYCDEIKELLKKYSNKYDYINTTVKQWRTGFFTREVYLRYYAIKQK